MADHVILTQVAAGFHGDESHRQAPRIFQAVQLAEGDVDGIALAHEAGPDADGNLGGAFDHHPVFGTVEVRLHRGRFTRRKAKSSDAEAPALGQRDRGGGAVSDKGRGRGFRKTRKA